MTLLGSNSNNLWPNSGISKGISLYWHLYPWQSLVHLEWSIMNTSNKPNILTHKQVGDTRKTHVTPMYEGSIRQDHSVFWTMLFFSVSTTVNWFHLFLKEMEKRASRQGLCVTTLHRGRKKLGRIGKTLRGENIAWVRETTQSSYKRKDKQGMWVDLSI